MRNASLAALQVVAVSCTLLLVYHYLVRRLGVEAIGVWAVVFALTAFGRVVDVGFSQGVTRFVAVEMAAGRPARAIAFARVGLWAAFLLFSLVAFAVFPFGARLLALAMPTVPPVAVQLLPYALAALVLGTAAAVVQGAIDGLQRADVRSMIAIAASLVQLVLTLALVPSLDLRGVAIAQVSAYAVTLLVGWTFFARHFRGVPPTHDKAWSIVRELVRFGLPLQAINILLILLDPVTKILLARFGSFSAVGLYEMASRLVLQARTVIVAAAQVIMPAISGMTAATDKAIARLEEQSYQVVLAATAVVTPLLLASLPFVGRVWLKQVEPAFLVFGTLLSVAWGANALTAPAYFSALGRGIVRWNVAGHALMAAVTVVGGVALGLVWGGAGVVLAVATALVLGSAVTLRGSAQLRVAGLGSFLPKESRALLLQATIVSLASVMVINRATPARAYGSLEGLVLLGAILLLGVVAWRHQLARRLRRRVMGNDGLN